MQYPISANVSYACKKYEGLPMEQGFVHVKGPIEISAIKKAEDTDDLVLRVYEQYGIRTPFSVTLEGGLTAYRKTDLLEYGGESVVAECIEDVIEPFSVQTYVIEK